VSDCETTPSSAYSSRKDSGQHESFTDPTPEYTFTLPDLSIHPSDFSAFLEKDLIEKSSLVALEGAGRLNWWTDIGLCQKLWPLATTGDGNCLLHAASLGIWGFHDRLLTLRKALYSVLSSSSLSDAFYRRWRWQSSHTNRAAGLILCEDEWAKEWKSLMQMASTQPRLRNTDGLERKSSGGGKKTDLSDVDDEGVVSSGGQLTGSNGTLTDGGTSHVYESLEEIHILALAHVLRRPIIVVADTVLKDVTGEPFAPIPFGGVYLPLEFSPQDCHRSPLCLTYDAAHFTALVAMDKESYADDLTSGCVTAAIPLVDPNDSLLPIQFATDPGSNVDWKKIDTDQENQVKAMTCLEKVSLLKSYLDVVELKPSKSPVNVVPASQEKKSATLPAKLDAQESQTVKQRSCSTSEERTCSPISTAGLRKKVLRWMRFTSLRRSMSKKFRNKWQLAKTARNSFRFKRRTRPTTEQEPVEVTSQPTSSNTEPQGIYYCARLHTEKRHDYQDEMIRNYLTTARIRFKEESKEKETTAAKVSTPRTSTSSSDSSSLSSTSSRTRSLDAKKSTDDHYASQCVNTGCKNYGTAATSYLCSTCFSDQKTEMEKKEDENKKSIDDLILEKDVFGSNEELEKKTQTNNRDSLSSGKLVSSGPVIGC